MLRIFVPLVFCVCAGSLLSFGAPGDGPIDKSLRQRFARALHSGDDAEISRVTDLLAGIGSPEAVRMILRVVAEAPSTALREQAVVRLKELGPDRLDAPFRALLSGKRSHPYHLAAALSVASEIEGEQAEGWLLLGLGRDEDVVLRNAIDFLDKRRSKRAIPALIELLDELDFGSGTTSYMIRVALTSLTGQSFETIEDWQNFWEVNQASLDPANLDAEHGTTGVVRKSPDVPEFFGIEIVSRRVVFVIDVSGSMTKWDPGGEDDSSEGSSWEVRQRIRRTQRQLGIAIDKLAKNAFFNVVAFNHQIQTFQRQLVKANRGAKNGAYRWAKKLRADNATHTGEALRKAFEDPRVDTIILLSDGAPMRSQRENASVLIPKILEDVRHLNALRKVKIHTLGFEGEGRWPPGSKYARNTQRDDPAEMIRFLQQLAREHGGTYTSID